LAARFPKPPKRQHFVPRCYLGGFTGDGETICAFDKTTGRSFQPSLMNIAQECGFYDLPGDAFVGAPADWQDPQIAEKAFGPLEVALLQTIHELLRQVETGWQFSRDIAVQMAPHVVRQMLRTRRARQHLSDTCGSAAMSRFVEYLKSESPDLIPQVEKHVRFFLNEPDLTVLHVQEVFSSSRIAGIAEGLVNHIWVVGMNQTGRPFYTSDDPVVRLVNAQLPLHTAVGLQTPGIEIAFPLTSSHILLLFERQHFADWEPLDGLAIPMSDINVRRYNGLQVHQSHRQLYCESDQFEQAREECRYCPHICHLDREHLEPTWPSDVFDFLLPR
jgi:hypothetical protein